jgi:Tol biopolymer transport system component
MKRAFVIGITVVALGAGAMLQAQSPRSADVQMKAAQQKGEVEGDLKGAIEEYKKVVAAAGSNRELAAQALVRMAECYQKLGDSEAQRIYERLVREFADQPESVAVARARLRGTPTRASVGVTLKALPQSDGLPGGVSPDGRYLTFASWNDGQLYVRDLRTGSDRALTQRKDFNIGGSAISGDATLVAYQSYGRGCEGKEGGLPALCLVSLAAKGVPASKVVVESEDILEIAPMGWSPDGRTVAVSMRRQDRTAQIGLVTVADGSIRVLQSVDWRGPTRIFFSPDGLDVVFDLPVSDTGDDRNIVILAVDGSRGLTAVEHPSQNIVMGWTPDGSQMLFASDRGGSMGLWAQPFGERRPQGRPRLVRSDLGGAWSLGVTKEGSLYFGSRKNDRDISVTTIDLATGKQLTPPIRPIRKFVGTNLMPDWSSDGRYLAYVSQRGFNPTNNTGRIIGVRDMTTGEERELHPKLLYFGPVSWSPDGAALLTAGTDVRGRTGVFTIDARTADVSLVVEGTLGSYPQWSPDGKRLFYRQGASGQLAESGIVERDITSGAERKVVSGEFQVFGISPDGRSIVAPVRAIAGGAAGGVVRIGVDNGELRDLLRAAPSQETPPFIAPQWTPDGGAVLVHMRSPNELWLVPTTGAPPRKLDVDVRDWSFGGVGQFSLHPDGRRIAFLSGSLSNEVMVLENFLPRTTPARR